MPWGCILTPFTPTWHTFCYQLEDLCIFSCTNCAGLSYCAWLCLRWPFCLKWNNSHLSTLAAFYSSSLIAHYEIRKERFQQSSVDYCGLIDADRSSSLRLPGAFPCFGVSGYASDKQPQFSVWMWANFRCHNIGSESSERGSLSASLCIMWEWAYGFVIHCFIDLFMVLWC